MNLRVRLTMEWIAIGLIASMLVIGSFVWRGSESFDNILLDHLGAASRPAADANILIIAIDDDSLSRIGKWPWDRTLHARLLDRLQAARPRSVVFDILLSEPATANADAALARSMADAAMVYLPMHFVAPGSNGRAFDPVPPAAPFVSAAKAVGHVNLSLDADGTVRRAALCFKAAPNAREIPHLMEWSYRATGGQPSPAYRRLQSCDDEYLIPYAKRGSFAQIPYADVLAGNVPPAWIAGRDVIIGATAAGMGDNFPVPNGDGGLLSGAEIMANMLGALKRDDFIVPLDRNWTVLLSLLPMWLLLIGFLRWRPRLALGASLLSLLLILLFSASLLWTRLWFPPGAALLGVLLVYPLWGWRRLQAMSDFMAAELGALEREGEAIKLPIAAPRTDIVGQQSEALSGAIDHMRDLRRFVADTLADLPDPMFVTDPAEKVTLSNRLLDERLGYPVAGMALDAALDGMVAAQDRMAVDRFLTTQDERAFVRFTSPHDRSFVMRRSQVRSNAGVLHGHIHYLTDITALAKAEAEREEVLQLLSHDMRAPQSTIIALLDGEIDADARKRIERNARRTMQLAQDFVDIARMAETKFDGEDILLADLWRDAADSFWPLANERGIRIEVADNSGSGFVVAEPDTLSRAIANLVDNAIKFSPDRGIVKIFVDRVMLGDAPWLSAAITDQGTGISADIMPRLFNRFATGGDHQGRVRGTGLGLSFVQAVVARHGGRIRAENIAGSGARFTLELPEAPDR
jgi:CHASE2 domain-containing sensor protein/signal transduction histidine kinase